MDNHSFFGICYDKTKVKSTNDSASPKKQTEIRNLVETEAIKMAEQKQQDQALNLVKQLTIKNNLTTQTINSKPTTNFSLCNHSTASATTSNLNMVTTAASRETSPISMSKDIYFIETNSESIKSPINSPHTSDGPLQTPVINPDSVKPT